MHTVQEMRCLDKVVRYVKADFGVGDFNLAVSSKASAGHKVITEISTPGVMRFLPALEYDDAQLREHCVSNECTLAVHVSASICASFHAPMRRSQSSLSLSLAIWPI